VQALEKAAREKRLAREGVEEYVMADGRRLRLLSEGRLVNLAAAEGHPAQVMDMSFANQAMSVQYLLTSGQELGPKVYAVPKEIDREVARLKLASMRIRIEQLTAEQEAYLASYDLGTS